MQQLSPRDLPRMDLVGAYRKTTCSDLVDQITANLNLIIQNVHDTRASKVADLNLALD
jgi:hypothetical protein